MVWVGRDRVQKEQKGCGEERRFVGRTGFRERTLLKEFIIIVSEWVHHTWTKAVSIIFTGNLICHSLVAQAKTSGLSPCSLHILFF